MFLNYQVAMQQNWDLITGQIGSAMDNEGKTTIENLRKDLENKHRFTSVWRGYNKRSK